MSALVHNTQYLAQALSRLLDQFKGKPRFAAVLESWENEIQALEDAIFAVYLNRLIQLGLATGDLLDKIGKLVGQAREGNTDAAYLILITARIRTNRSDGKRESLIAITSLLVPLTPIKVREYRGAIVITADGPVTVPPNVIAFEFLARAPLAGVRVTFVYMIAARANTLRFGYRANGGGGITQPSIEQSPGYHATGPLDPFYLAGGLAAGAFTIDGGSA